MFAKVCAISLLAICTLSAREANIDTNRIHLLPKKEIYSNVHERRSVPAHNKIRTNDYDDSSSWQFGQPPTLRVHVPGAARAQTAVKVHAPREDPRLFYQSDSYVKEINGKNVNREVTFIYPGREVIRAKENGGRSEPLRDERNSNMVNIGSRICIRCPHDRTLVARPGSDRVLLQQPRLLSCGGYRAPRNFRFVHMYGPKFGSLLGQGSHLVIGRIMSRNKNIQLCKMQVHVVTQGCATPNYLTSHCTGQNCTFSCRDPKTELSGPSSLICGNSLDWSGKLPICKSRIWCQPPPPPPHGRVTCKGGTAENSAALAEGARCRVRCAAGWHWHPRALAVCRRGEWTNSLSCHKSNKLKRRRDFLINDVA